MRHNAAYRPTIAPYDAQGAVLRVTGRVFARQRDVQQSVKKMNPVARLVRRLHIDDALIQIALINKKKAARALYEVTPAPHAAPSRGPPLRTTPPSAPPSHTSASSGNHRRPCRNQRRNHRFPNPGWSASPCHVHACQYAGRKGMAPHC